MTLLHRLVLLAISLSYTSSTLSKQFDISDCFPKDQEFSEQKIIDDYRYSIFKVYGKKKSGIKGQAWGTAGLVYSNKWFLTASHVHDIPFNSDYIKNELILVNEAGLEVEAKIVSKGDFYKQIDYAILLLSSESTILNNIKPIELSWKISKIGEKGFTAGFPVNEKSLESWSVGKLNLGDNGIYITRLTLPKSGESGSLVFKSNGKAAGIFIGSDGTRQNVGTSGSTTRLPGEGWIVPIQTPEILMSFTQHVTPSVKLSSWLKEFNKHSNNSDKLQQALDHFKCHSGLSQSDLILFINDIKNNLSKYTYLLKNHYDAIITAIHSTGLFSESIEFAMWLVSENMVDMNGYVKLSSALLDNSNRLLHIPTDNTSNKLRHKLISKRILRKTDKILNLITPSSDIISNSKLLGETYHKAALLHKDIYGLGNIKNREVTANYIIKSIKADPDNFEVASIAHDLVIASSIDDDPHLAKLTSVVDKNFKSWNQNILEHYAVTDKTSDKIEIITNYNKELSDQYAPDGVGYAKDKPNPPFTRERMHSFDGAAKAIKDLILLNK